jgi:outer membrane protein TolC
MEVCENRQWHNSRLFTMPLLPNYKQVVLTAFQQAEDDLASLRILARQIEQQQDAVASAQRYLDVASVRYRTGLDSYLNVFTAQSTLLTNQQTGISLRIEQIVSSVQLIETLGGGWDVTMLPSEKAVAAKTPIASPLIYLQ